MSASLRPKANTALFVARTGRWTDADAWSLVDGDLPKDGCKVIFQPAAPETLGKPLVFTLGEQARAELDRSAAETRKLLGLPEPDRNEGA